MGHPQVGRSKSQELQELYQCKTSRAVHFREKGDESTQVTGADTPCPRLNGADRDAALGIVTELIYFHGTKKSAWCCEWFIGDLLAATIVRVGVHKTRSGERKTGDWTRRLDERRVKSFGG